MAWDDPRVPGVTLGPEPLRLNSVPVPAAYLAAGMERGNRVAAVREWLGQACGDYAVRRVAFVERYLEFVAVDLRSASVELDKLVARFDGLYQAEDWMWSALRPLPRAWMMLPGGPAMAEIAFWDGQRLFAADFGMAHDGAGLGALRAAGVTIIAMAEPFASMMPVSFRADWRSDPLPSSPFRRPCVAGPGAPPR